MTHPNQDDVSAIIQARILSAKAALERRCGEAAKRLLDSPAWAEYSAETGAAETVFDELMRGLSRP